MPVANCQSLRPSVKRPLVVRINYCNFWSGFTHKTFQTCLDPTFKCFDLRLSDDPQVVIESVFGLNGEGRRRWPHAVQVWYTGENIAPPLDDFDFCLSFYRDIDDPRHFRWPLFLLHMAWHGFDIKDLIKNKQIGLPPQARSKFCAFVASNGNVNLRNAFVTKLSAYKHIDCPGAASNNMPPGVIGPPGDVRSKMEFLKQYKFAVCFENSASSSNEGYVTEKLTDAMLAGCIPLYWGDHRVGEDFNSQSFVNLTEYRCGIDSMIEKVIEIDRNSTECQKLVTAPCFPGNRIPLALQAHIRHTFFSEIFSRSV